MATRYINFRDLLKVTDQRILQWMFLSKSKVESPISFYAKINENIPALKSTWSKDGNLQKVDLFTVKGIFFWCVCQMPTTYRLS